MITAPIAKEKGEMSWKYSGFRTSAALFEKLL
jgi:hypothetical protein